MDRQSQLQISQLCHFLHYNFAFLLYFYLWIISTNIPEDNPRRLFMFINPFLFVPTISVKNIPELTFLKSFCLWEILHIGFSKHSTGEWSLQIYENTLALLILSCCLMSIQRGNNCLFSKLFFQIYSKVVTVPNFLSRHLYLKYNLFCSSLAKANIFFFMTCVRTRFFKRIRSVVVRF